MLSKVASMTGDYAKNLQELLVQEIEDALRDTGRCTSRIRRFDVPAGYSSVDIPMGVKNGVGDISESLEALNDVSGISSGGLPTFVNCPIDKAKKVDGVVTFQAGIQQALDLRADFINTAPLDLAVQIEKDVIGAMTASLPAGQVKTYSDTTNNKFSLDDILFIRKSFSDALLPASGRYIGVKTEIYNELLKLPEIKDASQRASAEAIANGIVPNCYGFTIVELPVLDDISGSAPVLAWHSSAAVYAPQAGVSLGSTFYEKGSFEYLILRSLYGAKRLHDARIFTYAAN
ncbi:hypothetical protein [uncultured Mediterranean phage uvMED]|nr:hypothetical protein [uncultured Mediterranean phage uvMED]